MSTREKELIERITQVKEDVANAAKSAGRDVNDVKLMAVSKLHKVEDIRTLYDAGHRTFGESYVQEALGKLEELSELDIDWHFIGGLQSNKAKYISGLFSAIHSVDSLKLATLINKKAVQRETVQNIFIQVNTALEEQKSGVAENELPHLMEEVLKLENVKILGLMALPPFFEDGEAVRPYFSKLRKLKEKMSDTFSIELPELSMGMTGDYKVAIEEGSTMVRVGTKIFGQRPR